MELCYEELTKKDLPDTWFTSYVANEELRLFEVRRQGNFHKPMVIVRMLLIQDNLIWKVYVADSLVPSQSLILKDVPTRVSRNSLPDLLSTVAKANICTGSYEERFVILAHARKGKFLSMSGETVAYLDESFCVQVDGVEYGSTIRHRDCQLLIEGLMCTPCYGFRNTLRSLAYKSSKLTLRAPSIYTNLRFLKTPQKIVCMVSLRRAIKMKNRQLKRLRVKLNILLEKDSVQVDEQLQRDLEKVADVHSVMEEDDFKKIFWQQQVCCSY